MVRFSILGAGHIAGKTALAASFLASKGKISLRAVASREKTRAEEFAAKFGFEKSFGSYRELAEDPETDLVYIATPNTFHARHALLCLENGKHVLCEKPFTANEAEAQEVFAVARRHGLFCGEAMWMRFLPASRAIENAVRAGDIGQPRLIEADFAIPVSNKERIKDPALGGGALLDLGIYPLAFALQHFGTDWKTVSGVSTLLPSGVDDQSSFCLTWEDGRLAALAASATAARGASGRIAGSCATIEVPQLVRCEGFRIVPFAGGQAREFSFPFDCNGYEYEIAAAASAVENGLPECTEAPRQATLSALRAMDALRASWGVRFPCD